jgi:hypothetical protein
VNRRKDIWSNLLQREWRLHGCPCAGGAAHTEKDRVNGKNGREQALSWHGCLDEAYDAMDV